MPCPESSPATPAGIDPDFRETPESLRSQRQIIIDKDNHATMSESLTAESTRGPQSQ